MALLLSAWLVNGRRSSEATTVATERAPAEPQPARSLEPQPAVLAPSAVPAPQSSLPAVVGSAPRPLPSEPLATDGLPYMPADPNAPRPAGFAHPHPVTPEHARIFRENATIQSLNDAMDARDVATLRSVLARYRSEYPEDEQRLQEGYELIANCLERGASERSAAQRYFDEERGSSLRRFVARYCLGGP
ncbi:MAG: hypothetical protein QM756_09790 [Polyangiaceae bacterium]